MVDMPTDPTKGARYIDSHWLFWSIDYLDESFYFQVQTSVM